MKSLSYISGFGLVLVLSIGLNGCGGGGGGSSTGNSVPTVNNPIPTSVTVERGKVYDATVVDSENHIAIQKNGTNIYRFDDVPKYPITVTNGWIDVIMMAEKRLQM